MWKFCGRAQFRANQPKLCRNRAFPQNFHTRKFGEITVFYAVFKIEFGILSWVLIIWRPVYNMFQMAWRRQPTFLIYEIVLQAENLFQNYFVNLSVPFFEGPTIQGITFTSRAFYWQKQRSSIVFENNCFENFGKFQIKLTWNSVNPDIEM